MMLVRWAWHSGHGNFLFSNKKAELPPATFTLVALGSPAVLGSLRIRDFLPLPYGRFGFIYKGVVG